MFTESDKRSARVEALEEIRGLGARVSRALERVLRESAGRVMSFGVVVDKTARKMLGPGASYETVFDTRKEISDLVFDSLRSMASRGKVKMGSGPRPDVQWIDRRPSP